ncbi:Intradiol ring-cleavage dioxygenase, partial [Amylostereum chailletii]
PVFKRDLDTVLSTAHLSNLTGVTADSDPSTLFTGNSSCVLAPETTQGPYYVNGEYVRTDIREDQEGVDLYVDVQLIDVSTCEPVPDVFIDFWHANATGVYSGIVASGNGNSGDASNLNTTFLRGIQETNADGVAQFITVFPGHYTSRATHIHILAQENGTTSANGTYKATDVKHVGQFFFDQDLITSVETTAPYSTNTQTLTTNADDQIMSEEADTIDPVLEYVLLGNDVSDGIFAWGAMGIDVSASYDISPAATLTEDGGVENANSGMGGGGMPSGSGFPSGS